VETSAYLIPVSPLESHSALAGWHVCVDF
jgi:hypothetical protein